MFFVKTKKWIAVFSLALLASLAPNLSQAGPDLTIEQLEGASEKYISQVEEFNFLRNEASRLGVRVWLFGGTAAGYLHYIKDYLKALNGDTRYTLSDFDHDYTSIYRSTQDCDLVIDGTAEQAAEIEANLTKYYPHLQGNKSAWEVRLLKDQRGDKEDLFSKDFQNQHTDSHSTGMVEVTVPPPKENQIRDIRDWGNQKNTAFEMDVLESKLHYYFSTLHETTSRFKRGLNPPILSVIRYFTKAFQYELQMRPEDLKILKSITDRFNPHDNFSGYVIGWIQRNSIKLIQHASNIEYAQNILNQFGLKSKLISMGDKRVMDSFAWWLNRSPLKSFPVGQGTGKSAIELGIQIVAHETKSFLAWESIRKPRSGNANVLESRDGFLGETAAYGDGFYTQLGTLGAAGTGLTLRFHVEPDAREGTDFFIASQTYIVFRNKAALTTIREQLNMTALEYFQMLKAGKDINFSDKALLEQLKRKIKSSPIDLSEPEYLEIRNQIKTDILSNTRTPYLEQWLGFTNLNIITPEIIDALIPPGSSESNVRVGTVYIINYLKQTVPSSDHVILDLLINMLSDQKNSYPNLDPGKILELTSAISRTGNSINKTKSIFSILMKAQGKNDIKDEFFSYLWSTKADDQLVPMYSRIEAVNLIRGFKNFASELAKSQLTGEELKKQLAGQIADFSKFNSAAVNDQMTDSNDKKIVEKIKVSLANYVSSNLKKYGNRETDKILLDSFKDQFGSKYSNKKFTQFRLWSLGNPMLHPILLVCAITGTCAAYTDWSLGFVIFTGVLLKKVIDGHIMYWKSDYFQDVKKKFLYPARNSSTISKIYESNLKRTNCFENYMNRLFKKDQTSLIEQPN